MIWNEKSSRLIQFHYLLPPTSRGNNITQISCECHIKSLDAAASVVDNLNGLLYKRKEALEIVAIYLLND